MKSKAILMLAMTFNPDTGQVQDWTTVDTYPEIYACQQDRKRQQEELRKRTPAGHQFVVKCLGIEELEKI
jgi:hypothetical protein